MLFKKLTTTFLMLSATLVSFADGEKPAQITSTPSPAISTKALEVKITTSDLGSEVYCYTWCKEINGKEVEPTWGWDDVNTAKFKMTGSGGTYTFKIDNIKNFYGLSDSQLEGLTKLGFIAKNKSGGQTVDCYLEVQQGPREVYGGGEGTASSPYLIKTAAHLQEFSTSARDWAADVYVKLDADVDAAGLTSPIGSLSNPYQGHFDGAGHTIKNLNLSNNTLGTATGLFGAVKDGEIHSLGVADARVEGSNHVGVLAGIVLSGKIERCFASGSVKGNSICVGGLVGENMSGIISDCYAGVKVQNGDDCATGGVAGKNSGTIRNVYATGEITGKDYVGGIVGANYGSISNSVALNAGVKGTHDYSARFGGNNNSQNQASNNHSWNEIENNGNSWKDHGDHATARPSWEFMDFTSFKSLTNWDFDNIWDWNFTDGKPYPVLRSLANQPNTIPDYLFQSSSVEEIFEAQKVNISVGPNPFSDYLTVSCTEPLADVKIVGINGMIVAAADCAGRSEVTLDMSAASKGLYIVSAVSLTGSKSTFKIIKK